MYGWPPVWMVRVQLLCLYWIRFRFPSLVESKPVKQEVSHTVILPLTALSRTHLFSFENNFSSYCKYLFQSKQWTIPTYFLKVSPLANVLNLMIRQINNFITTGFIAWTWISLQDIKGPLLFNWLFFIEKII